MKMLKTTFVWSGFIKPVMSLPIDVAASIINICTDAGSHLRYVKPASIATMAQHTGIMT
jgi:hypothetical protein